MHCNPAEINEVIITGSGLTIEKAVAVARFGAHVSVADSAVAAMRKSRALVEKILDENRVAYGISTGFGEFSKVSIGVDKSGELQENLILSHCVKLDQVCGQEIQISRCLRTFP